MAEWAATDDRPVAWVSLDRFDDDPAVLLGLLASAFTRVSPGSTDLVADLGGLGVSVLGRAAPRLASVLRASPVPFVLMVDDLHELRSPACHDVLSVVISGIPEHSQLVAASRSEQPHLPRLRASGDTLELSAGDLALDAAEAKRVFEHEHVNVTPDEAAAVTERTEGWPTGLYLSAVIARHNRRDALTVSGEHPFVADYLYRESLSQLPEQTQQFLRRTALLDPLCAPLCDAVLGETHSQEHLRELEASNLFLIPLDRRRHWYRYHSLFREFLLGELRRIEPEIITKLDLRSADWHESNGSPGMALEHLLNTAELDRSLRLMTALLLPTYQAGRMSTVQRWLSAVGDPAIEQYPPLAVLAGWLAVLNGEITDAQRWAAILDAASFELAPADGTASFDSSRAMLRAIMCEAGPEQMLADASSAVAQEPPWSPWRDTALCVCAEAHLLTGDMEEACALFAESSTLAATTGNAGSLVLSEAELALVAMDHGRWAEAADRLGLAHAAIEEHRLHDYAICVLAFAGAAQLEMHRGDPEKADRQLTRAMRVRPSCTIALPFIAVRLRLRLAKVFLAKGESATARHLLREIEDVLLHRPELGTLVDEVSEFREVVTSSNPPGATGASPLTPAELRLLPYLQTHLTVAEIGERLFVSRNTVSSEVASIYRKLGVSSRSQAVQQATSIGLLGE